MMRRVHVIGITNEFGTPSSRVCTVLSSSTNLSVASATPAVYLRRVQRIHVNPEHLISSVVPIKMILIIGIITLSYCSLLSITFLRSEWNIFFILFSKLNTKSFFHTADRLLSLVKSPIPCGIRQKERKKDVFLSILVFYCNCFPFL